MIMMQLIREHLTRSNLPTDQCAVCLYGFREGDEFTKTECYHYFHSHCLAAHVAAAERYYREEQEKLPQWQQDTTNKFQVRIINKILLENIIDIFSIVIMLVFYSMSVFIFINVHFFRLYAPFAENLSTAMLRACGRRRRRLTSRLPPIFRSLPS